LDSVAEGDAALDAGRPRVYSTRGNATSMCTAEALVLELAHEDHAQRACWAALYLGAPILAEQVARELGA
jgi:hypothetical protein